MGGRPAFKPAPQPSPPEPDDRLAKETEAKERQKINAKRGYGNTIATSGQGVLGAPPTTSQGSLKLGGT